MGNAVPDAWLAAATLHLGEHLMSYCLQEVGW